MNILLNLLLLVCYPIALEFHRKAKLTYKFVDFLLSGTIAYEPVTSYFYYGGLVSLFFYGLMVVISGGYKARKITLAFAICLSQSLFDLFSIVFSKNISIVSVVIELPASTVTNFIINFPSFFIVWSLVGFLKILFGDKNWVTKSL